MKFFKYPYVISFSIIIILGFYIWQKEADFLVTTERYEKPTIIYSSELQKKFLLDANFISNPYVKMNNKKQPSCFRPYLRIWHDSQELSRSDYNSCNNGTELDYWKGFGEALTVNDKYTLISEKSDTVKSEYHDLCYYTPSNTYSQCDPILTDNEMILKVQFNNSIKEVSLANEKDSDSTIPVLNFANGQINGEIPTEPTHSLKITLAKRDTFEIQRSANSNAVIISDISNSGNETRLECGTNSVNEMPRVSVHNVEGLTANIRFWCYSSRLEPNTEVERLAYKVSQYRINNSNKHIVSTIRQDANETLKQILLDSVGRRVGIAQALMMNQDGEILAMTSTKTPNSYNYEYIKDDIDNFKNRAPGSIVKPIFAHSVLSTVPELSTLEMTISDDNDCYLVDKEIGDNCDASNGFYNDTDHNGRFNFENYIARSDNVYSSTLLYLGSTVPLDENNCNASQRQLSIVTENDFDHDSCSQVPSPSATTINDRHVQCWLADRMGVFRETNSSQLCINTERPPWYDYMVNRNKVYSINNASYNLFGANFDFPSLRFDKSFIINPYSAFNISYTDGPFKWSRGGGESRWSSIGIAENFSSILSKQNVEATLVTHPDNNIQRQPYSDKENNASNAIIEGMRGAICSSGTASKLHGNDSNQVTCDNNLPTISINAQNNSNNIQVLAKTGTANENIIDYSNTDGQICLANAIVNELDDIQEFREAGYKPLNSWCSDNECKDLSSKGERVFDTLENRFANKTLSFNQETTLREQFLDWLQYHYNVDEEMPESLSCKNTVGEGSSVKRIVLSFARANSDDINNINNFNQVCTFVFINNNSGQNGSSMKFSKDVISEMKSESSVLARACGFTD